MNEFLMVDLSQCKIGQKLRTKSNIILTLVKYTPECLYPYCVEYVNGTLESRTIEGRVFRFFTDEDDIVEILPLDN